MSEPEEGWCPECDSRDYSGEVVRLRARVAELEASAKRGWEQADALHLTVKEVSDERDAARAEVEQWEKAASVLPGMDNPRSPQDLMDVSAKLRDLEAEVERLTKELAGLRKARNEKHEMTKRAYEEAQKQANSWAERAGIAEAEVERLKAVQQAAFNDAHRAEADNERLRAALCGLVAELDGCLFDDRQLDAIDFARAALAGKETP